MKKSILIGMVGILLPLVANGQSMTFFTTVGSPNGVFSNLEVKGLELKGGDACCIAPTCAEDPTCSVTVTRVEKVEFLNYTPTNTNTGMVYVPISKSATLTVTQPTDLGNVQFDPSGSLTGDVRTVATESGESFNDVRIQEGSELHVRRVKPLGAEERVRLTFEQQGGVSANPFLGVGIILPNSSFTISTMAVDRIWDFPGGSSSTLALKFRESGMEEGESRIDPSTVGNVTWEPCTGTLPNCTCDGISISILSLSCGSYRILSAQKN